MPSPQEHATIAAARRLHAEGRSLWRIARDLAEQGVLSRYGRPFEAMQIARMLAHY